MANKKLPPEVLVPGRNVRAQSKKAFAEEIAKRRSDQSKADNTLLSPDEIAGDYLLSRGLFTTLGGSARPITIDDLRTFSANVRNLKDSAKGKKMLGGIKAKQIIDKSRADDRERANKQIHMANPTHYKAITEGGGQGTALMVHFRTNAGPDSEFTHHNVNVEFLDFGAVVASPMKAEKMAKVLTSGRLKFECNCPRFKYFFRYVCTQIEVNAGRSELAFPKIRNPGLTGISCKHGLRVMQTIMSSGTFNNYIAKVIQKFRDDIAHTESVERIADQREFEEKRKKEDSRKRKIKSTEEKRAQRAAQPSQIRRAAEREAKLQKSALEKAKQKAKSSLPSEGESIAKMMKMFPGMTENIARAAYLAAKAAE